MSSLSVIVGGAGVKKITRFEVSNPVDDGTFNAVDITSAGVVDMSKTSVNMLSTYAAFGATGGGNPFLVETDIKLVSTTSVEYFIDSTPETLSTLNFEVIEYN